MIGYLGPQGTFSHLAASQYYMNTPMLAYASIHALIRAVSLAEIDAAIVPAENSIEGGVNATLDALYEYENLSITGELILPIRQNLLARRGVTPGEIVRIISHLQSIAQCSQMLERDFYGVPIEYAASTASAAKTVALSDEPFAVTGSSELVPLYSLEIIKADCGNEKNNSTRFITLAREPFSGAADKTSVVFELESRPGSLYEALGVLARHGINMIKIESRPIKTHLGRYLFFIDMDGDAKGGAVGAALSELGSRTELLRVLVSYKKGDVLFDA